MKLRWTRFALEDLRHLHEYIAEDNPHVAGRMIARIQEAALHLKRHPQMGRQGRVQGTRELVIAGTPYIVVYIPDGIEVQIVAVFHSAMRWPDNFIREDS